MLDIVRFSIYVTNNVRFVRRETALVCQTVLISGALQIARLPPFFVLLCFEQLFEHLKTNNAEHQNDP